MKHFVKSCVLFCMLLCEGSAQSQLLQKYSNALGDDNVEAQYQKALELNRTKQYLESSNILKGLMESHPKIERYKSDYIAVASNAKMCDEVLKYASPEYLTKASNYVIDSILLCLATNGVDSFNKSTLRSTTLKLDKAGEKRLIQLALDTQNENAALYWSEHYINQYPQDLYVWRMRAQALQGFNQEYQALLIYEDLYKLTPQDSQIQKQIIQILLELGVPHLTLSQLEAHREQANPMQKLRALSNVGATDVHWDDTNSSKPQSRFTSVDKGIQVLQMALDYAKQMNASKEQINAIEFDLSVAYEKRKEWQKGIAIYESLVTKDIKVPDQAQLSAAIEYSIINQYSKLQEILIYQALLIYEDLYKLSPQDSQIQKQIIQILLDLGIPHLALSQLEAHREQTNPIQKLRALSNAGATDVRWDDTDSSEPPNRFASVDKGIQVLQMALDYAKQMNASKEQINAIEFDLIVAYEKRKEWQKGIAIYESLVTKDIKVPDQAQLSAAIEYSGIHQYAKAQKILEDLYQRNPKDPAILINVYFNLIELDKFTEAKLALDQYQIELKNRSNLDQLRFASPWTSHYTEALIDGAYFEAYQDRNENAFKIIHDLLGGIPANDGALNAAGSISEWQTNHMLAEEYFKIAVNQDPLGIESKLGLANTRMSQGDIQSFRKTVNETKDGYGDLESVQKAVRRLKLSEGPYITGNFALVNGYNNTQTNNAWTGDLRGYSKLIDDNYRGFARYRGLYSGPAVSANVQGVGGGIQYTGINRGGEVEVGNMGYARIAGTQILNDHWSTNASYERNAFYLQPGALYANFSGNVAGLNLGWKNNDTTESYIGYRYWTFGNDQQFDSNQKKEVFGSLTQRILTQYNYKLDASGWIANQTNTNPDAGYFAPTNQTQYSGTLTLRILQWRDLETKTHDFWHRIYASYGQVSQASFSTLPMNSYGYGQEFRIGERKTLSWGVSRTSFPFDGARFSYTTGWLNFEVHFE